MSTAIPLFNGMKLRPFKKKGHPSPVSATDLNDLVRVLNALLNPKVVIGQGNKVEIADGIWQFTLDNAQLGTSTSTSPPPASSGMNYKGTYNNVLAYNVGDVVRVKSGGSGSLGVWICVQAVAGGGTPPSWPEPNDASPANVNTWELLSLSPKVFGGCAGGAGHSFYISMLET